MTGLKSHLCDLAALNAAPGRASRGSVTARADRSDGAVERGRRGKAVTLRLRVRDGTLRAYRTLEHLYRRSGSRPNGFLAFLCLNLIDTWKPALGSAVAYDRIYARDRYRCQSPVCGRRDVTPHHLRFRSAGGDDGDENLVSLCSACHLQGVHEGRLSALPPASRIRWAIGRVPHTWVDGRTKIRSA